MSWKNSLKAILRAHNRKAARGGKQAASKTQANRAAELLRGLETLAANGIVLPDVKCFRENHLRRLIEIKEAQGCSAATLRNIVSHFRVLAGWLKKHGMIKATKTYVKDEARQRVPLVTTVSRCWSDKGVDIAAKVEEIRPTDAHVSAQLEVMHAFGLRPEEAIKLRPRMADKGAYLDVQWGTKGGRPRIVAIDSEQKREVLERAKGLVSGLSHSLIPRGKTYKQCNRRFYHVCEKFGITKKQLGVTAVGLRHEYANAKYESATGVPSPVRRTEPVSVPREIDIAARMDTAHDLGHVLYVKTGAYVGGIRHNRAARGPDSKPKESYVA